MEHLFSESSIVQQHDSTYEDELFFKEKHTRYKSLKELILILSTFALSSTYFGYSMVYLATIQFRVIAELYHISQNSLSMSMSQGIAMAAVPIGAGVGAYNSKRIIQRFSRKNSVLFVNLITIISTFCIFYRQFQTFVIFRFIQGICTGLYSAIIPMIVKQLAPVQISGSLGVFPQFFISIGCTTGYMLAFILGIITNDITGQSYWMFSFAFPIVLLSIQSFLLIRVFPYQTPKYLLSKKRIDQAIQLLKVIYKDEYVDEVLLQKKIDLNMITQKQIRKSMIKIRTRISGLTDKSVQNLIQEHQHLPSTKTAFAAVIYLSLLQQFAGPNVAVAYGAQIMQTIVPELKTVIPTFLMLLTVFAAAFTIYLLKSFGRKTLLQVGSLGSGITLAITTLGFFTHNSLYIILGLVFYSFIFGFSLGPVVWLYIPQIIQPNLIGIGVAFNWIGASSIIGLFPIVIDILPDNNPGFVFGLFALICFGSLYFTHKLIVQTKDKTEKQIGQEYEELQQKLGLFKTKVIQREQEIDSIEQDQTNQKFGKHKTSIEMSLLNKQGQINKIQNEVSKI